MAELAAATPMTSSGGMPPVPGRECGECDACCIHLTIIDPALKKVQGVRCRHLAADARCGIYDSRPDTCRTFYCAWRTLAWVREPLRPDRSGVLLKLREQPAAFAMTANAVELTLACQLLTRGGIEADGLAETIAAAIVAGIRVFVEIPGPAGYTSGSAEITHAVQDAVRVRDKPAVLALLRQCWDHGQRGQRQKIRLDKPMSRKSGRQP